VFGRIVNITSAQVLMPQADMGLSVSARAGLMAMSKVLQFDCVADNVTVNNLLPGPFDTDRLAALAQRYVEEDGITLDQAYARIGRAARPGASASRTNSAMPAPSCAAQAGYISGQCLTWTAAPIADCFEHAGPLGARACLPFPASPCAWAAAPSSIAPRPPSHRRARRPDRAQRRGKSTLMKVLIGQIEPDEGSVDMPRRARLGYIAQEAPNGTATPFETVLAADTERRAARRSRNLP
jgi:hypothetical protein